MKTQKKEHTKIVKTIVEKFVRVDANSTTCMAVYQPKAPEMLKKFGKIDNDK